ncbi:MAG: hypothetical protein JWM39_881 [Parcubacteria group bacterium]|nr:hypothetical protein [Parcubacteria group bacterium]
MSETMKEQVTRMPTWAKQYAFWQCVSFCRRILLAYFVAACTFYAIVHQVALLSMLMQENMLPYLLVPFGLFMCLICAVNWLSYPDHVEQAEREGQEESERSVRADRFTLMLSPIIALGALLLPIVGAYRLSWMISVGVFLVMFWSIVTFINGRKETFGL